MLDKVLSFFGDALSLEKLTQGVPKQMAEVLAEVASIMSTVRDDVMKQVVLREDIDAQSYSGVGACLCDLKSGSVQAGLFFKGDIHGGMLRGFNVVLGDILGGEVSAVNVVIGDVRGGNNQLINAVIGDIYDGDISKTALIVGDVHGGRVRAATLIGDIFGGDVQVQHHVGSRKQDKGVAAEQHD